MTPRKAPLSATGAMEAGCVANHWAGADFQRFYVCMGYFANFDVEILNELLRFYVEVVQGEGCFFIRFASPARDSVNTLQLFQTSQGDG